MKLSIKILILEPKENDIEAVDQILKSKNVVFSLTKIKTRDGFIEALHKDKPDIILANHECLQFNAIEALEIRKKIGFSAPFILITDPVSESFACSCFRNGADDYILKSNISQLPIAIKNAMERKVIELKRKQNEKSLAKQNTILGKVNREMDQFIHYASRNLRSPLTTLRGLITVSRDEIKNLENTRLQEYFNMIEESLQRMDITLNEVIDFSKNATLTIQIEKINVTELINGCLEKLEGVKGITKLNTNVIVDGENIVFSDRYRLELIVTHLISNAVQYLDSRKRKSQLTIVVATFAERSIFSFKDNGIGVYAENVERIFDMSFRGSERGTGLGLYIVNETIKKLGGSISIDSEVGLGTTIEIEIPQGHLHQKSAVHVE